MANLIDGDDFTHYLYSSVEVSPTKYPEMFNFCEFKFNFVDIANHPTISVLLSHYLSIVQEVYGREFIEHIPKMMYKFLDYFKIEKFYFPYDSNFTANGSYRNMTKNPMTYKCENAYFYTKAVRVMDPYHIKNRLKICRTSKPKPRMLIQLAAEIYINSRQWIYTSTLNIIQYNFKDLVFAHDEYETYSFYDFLLIKFLFQYFLKRNDTNFPVFRLICKCTYGLKNKNHRKELHLSEGDCLLCNALESNTFKQFLYEKNRSVCVCDD